LRRDIFIREGIKDGTGEINRRSKSQGFEEEEGLDSILASNGSHAIRPQWTKYVVCNDEGTGPFMDRVILEKIHNSHGRMIIAVMQWEPRRFTSMSVRVSVAMSESGKL